ncbi:hypothetical protein VNO80_09846 [Phaseolus coccineus]|uniref:Uncharacterized protein n=1 Tax=Phaseolus coccineus TaxID=3886 RepID=A0AAN9NCA6_PHACN
MKQDQVASYFYGPLPQKINLISCEPIVHISDIKLIRTDTTLDLSQKAEKVHISDIKLIRTDTTLDLSQKAEKGPCKSATQEQCLKDQVASYFDGPLPQKINLISCELIVHISDIKLIRTDTTLDLSQKAEKGML